ncbi:hypothetical protein CEXT_683811 [Caerostris extrusa]|uniref:Uncharacterized protein n=1 Tax=Caerostris extrusa TaxID=172846 RepID=A0AAV4S5R2_CAEEX|nr:hypothetical protein CEXT_683811 [Caerostris extrusa]
MKVNDDLHGIFSSYLRRFEKAYYRFITQLICSQDVACKFHRDDHKWKIATSRKRNISNKLTENPSLSLLRGTKIAAIVSEKYSK